METVKKGYSGTAIFSKSTPKKVTYDMGIAEHDKEGRVITLEYPKFHLVNVYTPNSKRKLLRLDYRQQWDIYFLKHCTKLQKTKPVIFCGDLNVAHKEIDLKNPKSNKRNAGFTDEERSGFDNILGAGFIHDTSILDMYNSSGKIENQGIMWGKEKGHIALLVEITQ